MINMNLNSLKCIDNNIDLDKYSINNFIKDNFKQTSTKEFKIGIRNIYEKKL